MQICDNGEIRMFKDEIELLSDGKIEYFSGQCSPKPILVLQRWVNDENAKKHIDWYGGGLYIELNPFFNYDDIDEENPPKGLMYGYIPSESKSKIYADIIEVTW